MSGVMIVRSAAPYQLRMDGVVWEPIESTDAGDEYSINSGGRCTIFADERLAFYFTNDYTADFSYRRNELNMNDASETRIASYYTNGTYNQRQFLENCASLLVAVYANDMETAGGLEFSTNQEGVTINKYVQDGYVRADIQGFEVSKYLQVFLGNVLLSFITPAD